MVGGEDHIDLPLAAGIVQRLASNVLSWVLIFDHLGSLCNHRLVVCQEANFLKVLAIKKIDFAPQTSKDFRRNML